MVITSKTSAKSGAAAAVQAPSSSSRLFVQNLPAYVDTKRLREHFASQGEVTDAVVVKTKDGAKSRRFGFVGYKTEQQAAQAKAFFHQSFIDTCRINVTFAVAREGESSARPWSKYTAGSSRHQELQETKDGAKTKSKTGKKKDEEQEELGTDKQAKKPTKGDVVDESNPAFQEFMETMQARSKSKFWANDDVQDPTKKAAADEEAKRLLQDSEDEDDDDNFQVPSDDEGGESDSDSDDEKLRKGEPKKSKGLLSDLDFLRSKVNKKLDKEEEEVDSDEEMTSDAEEDEEEEENKKKKPASGGADTNDKTNDQEEDDNKPTSRLFVRNLPFTAVEEDLTDLFSSFGQLVEVHMPLDETKRRKGFGFVQFSNTVDAATACEQLNGFAFQGRRLHVFYAKQKPLKVDPQAALQDPTLTYKQKKELERQLAANKTTGWNASFIRGDATVGSLAERMGVARGEILDKEAGSMAVRLAIGETMLVQENKEFFAKEGVDLDAIQGALVKPGAKANTKIERSTTVILVKNLPHTTQEDELAALFRKHGELGRFLLAPSKTLALVEFFEPSEARRAFRSLAYKKFQHVPLYLEWAPLKVFTSASTATKSSATLAGVKTTADGVVDASADAVDDVVDTSAANTLCVKNLSFETKESGLEKLFKTCGRLRKVTVARRKDPRRGMLSMGFGFVEFADAKDAEKALATLQGTVLDGHALTLRVSNNATSQGRKRKADADEEEDNGKVIGTGRRTKLIVRNVAFEATTQELRELFGSFGQLKRVRMPKKFDGKHRGFAFVEFLTEQEAQAAYKALASSHLYGRHLVLEWAEDADDLDTLRAKATKDVGAIQQSDRRKRARELKEDELDQQAEDADY